MFKQTASICLSHAKVLSIITPRSFWFSTSLIISLSTQISITPKFATFWRKPTVMTEVLPIWLNMLFDKHQFLKSSVPICSLDSTVSCCLPDACRVASSAYMSKYVSMMNSGHSQTRETAQAKGSSPVEPRFWQLEATVNFSLKFWSIIHCFLFVRCDRIQRRWAAKL